MFLWDLIKKNKNVVDIQVFKWLQPLSFTVPLFNGEKVPDVQSDLMIM